MVNTDIDTIVLLLKSVLQVSQGQRHLAGCLWTTCLVPYSWAAVQAARLEAKNYAARVQEAGKSHGYGPPHPHILRAFAEKAMERVEEVAGEDVEMQDNEEADLAKAKKLSEETELGRQIGALLGFIDGHASPTDFGDPNPFLQCKGTLQQKKVRRTARSEQW